MEKNPNHTSRNLSPGFANNNPSEIFNSNLSNNNENSATRDAQPTTHNPQPSTPNSQPELCYAIDLGMMDYNETWKLQGDIVSARIKGTIDTDIILFLEHPTVFTLGRRGGLDHLLVPRNF